MSDSKYGPYRLRKLHIRKFYPNGSVLVLWANQSDEIEIACCDSLDHARKFAEQIGLDGILL